MSPVQEPRVNTVPPDIQHNRTIPVQELRVQKVYAPPMEKINLPAPRHRIPTPKNYQQNENYFSPYMSTNTYTQQPRQQFNHNYDSYSHFRAARPRLIPFLLQNATHKMHHIFTGEKKETLDTLLRGPTKAIWEKALCNELGRLAQGMKGRVRATDTVEFIAKHEVPKETKITYANMVCDHRPLKAEPYRVRLTVGGDRLDYHGDASSPTATGSETKILFNSIISDAKIGARFCSADLADFFLESPMEKPEYMRIHSKYFPAEMKEEYDIAPIIAHDNYVYVKIKKGMYGLKQATIIAYKHLVKNYNHMDTIQYQTHQICGPTHRELQFSSYALMILE